MALSGNSPFMKREMARLYPWIGDDVPKSKSADLKDRAAAGMEAFGKNPKKMKGPMTGSKAPPFGKKPPVDPAEPDADDMPMKKGNPFGKGQDKKKAKGKY